MTDRARLVADRINRRYHEIAASVPPHRPPPCHWLYSDSTESFCRRHAIEARGREFDMGVPLDPYRPSYRRTDLEDAFHEGIGATLDGESETSEQCCRCGETLAYVLTDYGVDLEVGYWLDDPVSELTPETVYALDRLCLNVCGGMKRKTLLDVAVVVRRAHGLLTKE